MAKSLEEAFTEKWLEGKATITPFTRTMPGGTEPYNLSGISAGPNTVLGYRVSFDRTIPFGSVAGLLGYMELRARFRRNGITGPFVTLKRIYPKYVTYDVVSDIVAYISEPMEFITGGFRTLGTADPDNINEIYLTSASLRGTANVILLQGDLI